MNAPLLTLAGVERRFYVSSGMFKAKRVLSAVSGVSLTIARGDVIALVGESGCGKSTLARMILGLLAPSAGEILFDGVPLGRLGRFERARRMQPIFQDPYSSLNPRKTVGAIIGLPLVVHRIGEPASRPAKVAEMMDRVGLARRLRNAFPGQLSGGQRQRVAVARALIMRPDVVICDEPTSALDVSVQSQILNLLQDLQKDFHLTLLLISHNLAVVEHLARRVAVMYLGRIVEEAPTATLFRTPRHPYTQALLASILTPEPGLGVPETNLGATFPNPLAPPPGCSFHPRCPQAMPICTKLVPETRRVAESAVACHLYESAMIEGDIAGGLNRATKPSSAVTEGGFAGGLDRAVKA